MGDIAAVIKGPSLGADQPEEPLTATPSEEPVPVALPVVEPPAPEAPHWWSTGPARAALIVLVVFALAYMLQVTRELVLPIVVALLIAIVLSPIARALRGAAVGDLRTVRLPAGEKEWEVLAIRYPEGGFQG